MIIPSVSAPHFVSVTSPMGVLFPSLRRTEYYSAIKNNEYMKFLGKWMELKNIILSEVTQITNEHTWYAFTDKWILVQILRISKI